MPRSPRLVVPRLAHHVTQRGIRRLPIFHDSDDRVTYTEVIAENCVRYGLTIRRWCWMTNHVHLVLVPEYSDSLAMAFRRAHSTYARRFNLKYRLSGYLWQNRFYSCPLDEPHMWAAIRYVEQNPLRAGMVPRAESYFWSSAQARCGGRSDPLLDSGWTPDMSAHEWSKWLNSDLDWERHDPDPAVAEAAREALRLFDP